MQHFYICRSPGLSAPEQNVMKKVTWQSQCLNILQNTITHCSLTTAQRVQRANIMSLCCVQRLLAQPDWTKSIPQVSLSDLEVWNQKKDRWCWDGERGARQGHNWRWEHFLFSAISPPKKGEPQAQLNMSDSCPTSGYKTLCDYLWQCVCLLVIGYLCQHREQLRIKFIWKVFIQSASCRPIWKHKPNFFFFLV